LLRRLTADFRVLPADVDETLAAGPTSDTVAALALRKARAVADSIRQGVVLGADTVVVIDGDILGKPEGPAEAKRMLRRLRGRRHEVVTGVAVVDATSGRWATEVVVTAVLMRDYDDATIEAYVASGEPLDKAGAYAIQETGAALVAGWIGSFSNVIGLPVETTRRLLADFGIAVSAPASRSRA